MRRVIVWLFSFLFAINSFAQKDIDGLIQAEKNFAAFSVTNSTKEAFLKFLDSSGIVFVNGKVVNGIETWSKREKRPGILNWCPQHVEIAASGDLGYTTGPWTFQPKTIHDSIIARGQYTTVWHKDGKGEWKFLVDIGTDDNPAPGDESLHKIKRTNSGFKPGDENSLLTAEKNFIIAIKKSKPGAYKKYMSTLYSLLERNNEEPASMKDAYTKIGNATPDSIGYTILGSGIAFSGDLGYIYGSTVISDKTENYLRIWRKEKEGWKIAVEVLRY
ncbi:MAG: nuclear transport factor 2 family protein [Bacteroidia bacterium]|nr:nuclear transport factor 2 family protein [Bacteroidia bacterium]